MSAFFKEVKALQECRHPQVVRYIDRAFETVTSGVHFYIIMEYMSEVRRAMSNSYSDPALSRGNDLLTGPIVGG